MHYGCVPCKSLALKIESSIPEKYVPDFLRGAIDGDGCIYIQKRSWTNKNGTSRSREVLGVNLVSASPNFIGQIRLMIPNHIKYNIVQYNKTANVMTKIVFYDRYAQELLRWIYYPSHELSLTRKLNLSVRALNLSFGRRKRTDDERNGILELRSHGFGYKEIATQLSIPYQTVWDIINTAISQT
jgi:hypothetical protein